MGHLEHKLYLHMLSMRPAESPVSRKEFFFTQSSTIKQGWSHTTNPSHLQNIDRGLSHHNYLELTSKKNIYALMFISDFCQSSHDGSKGIRSNLKLHNLARV